MCTYHVFCVCSSISSFGCFCVLAVVNNAAVNVAGCVIVSEWCFCSVWIDTCPAVALLERVVVLFSFLRNLHTFLHGGCTSLHSQQQCTRLVFPLHPHQCLLFLVFLVLAILTGVRWYLTVGLAYISLMMSDAEHLFMYLLAISVSSLKTCQFEK